MAAYNSNLWGSQLDEPKPNMPDQRMHPQMTDNPQSLGYNQYGPGDTNQHRNVSPHMPHDPRLQHMTQTPNFEPLDNQQYPQQRQPQPQFAPMPRPNMTGNNHSQNRQINQLKQTVYKLSRELHSRTTSDDNSNDSSKSSTKDIFLYILGGLFLILAIVLIVLAARKR